MWFECKKGSQGSQEAREISNEAWRHQVIGEAETLVTRGVKLKMYDWGWSDPVEGV